MKLKMKKIIVSCLMVTLVVVMQLPSFALHYWNDDLSFTAAYGTVTIDGVIDNGEWDDTEAIEMRLTNDPIAAKGNVNYQGEWETEANRKDSDYQGTYKIKWDENYVYFLEIRVDDVVNLNGDASAPWTTDGALIFTQVDSNDSMNPDGISHHIFYTVGNGNGSVGGDLKVRICNMNEGTRDIVDIAGGKVAATLTSTGYIVEIAIPWSMYKSDVSGFNGVSAGDILGLSYVVHDSDSKDATGYEKQFCYAIDNDMLSDVPNGYDFGAWGTLELLPQVIEEVTATVDVATNTELSSTPVSTAPATTSPQTSDVISIAVIMLIASGAGVVINKNKKR